MEVPSGTNEATQDLNFMLQGVVNGNTSQVAGTYAGTLNFVADIETTGSTVSVAKGQIVTMSDLGLTDVDANADSTTDTFRVLSVDGSQVKLLAMDSYKSAYFDTSGISTYVASPGPTGTNTYASSTLDTEMINYYNDLPTDVQNAIVTQDINQLTYGLDTISFKNDVLHITDLYSRNYYYKNTSTVNVGNRNVFALDIQDIIDYLGSETTGAQLNEMFFGSGESVDRFVWLCSAGERTTDLAFYVGGNFGNVGNRCVNDLEYEVHPAFVLNLG